MTTQQPSPGRASAARGSSGLLLTGIYFGSMVLLYIGERLVFDSTSVRLGFALAALLGFAVAIGGRVQRVRRLGDLARPVERRILVCYLVGLVALLLYAAQADFMMDRLRPLFDGARAADRYQGALGALWPVLWLCSLLPLVFVEISYGPMSVVHTVELRRIQRSLSSGLVLAMSLSLVFVLNYVFNEHNKKVDLSYFKTTRPSESSKQMVKNLSQPMKAVLFFPGANEVQERVVSYFDGLDAASQQFSVQVADHALEPDLAKELGVTENGVAVLARGKQHEQIRLGVKLEQAKRTLRKLDQEFQNTFLKVSRAEKIAYFTVGHEERSTSDRDNVKGSSIRDLRGLLGKLHYQIKDLGVGQGLAVEVPQDASVVIVAGPKKELMPAEENALKEYVQRGGRLLVLVDPEAEWNPEGLLAPFGLKFHPVTLANDRYYARLTYSQADRHNVFSVRFSAHPSVRTMSQNSPKLATVLIGAGYLEEVPPPAGAKPQVRFTMHSMPFTWNDGNRNLQFDTGSEQRKVYELAAAVTVATAGGKPDKPDKPGAKATDGEDNEGRVIVVADSDLVSDAVFRHPGNGYLFLDAIKWLGGEEKYIGEVSSEEDVRIMHTRKEDQLWFYLTIFGMPALVLGCGLLYTRRRRKTR